MFDLDSAMGGDWQEFGQAVFIGLIFSFLVAKLISIVISFKEDNLKVVREADIPEPDDAGPTSDAGSDDIGAEDAGIRDEGKSLMGDESSLGDGEDWEGIESTELDEAFSAATAFVATTVADRAAAKISTDVQLQLYGLYKIATEGPCTAPQPSVLKMTARAKWNAWQKMGAMPPEEAMQKYIMIVNDLYPSWANGSTTNNEDGETFGGGSAAKGPMGPVFSSFVYEEDTGNDLKLDAVHESAREGDTDSLLKHVDNGVPVDLRDSEGRTPLHWAVDRGHINVVRMLLSKKADVNAKDNEGQTPLHYAALCDREAVAELLIKTAADPNIKDEDGNSPSDLCGSSWSFLSSAS